MQPDQRNRYAGIAAFTGGLLGLVLAPILVIVKYATGWAIIPQPSWISAVRPLFDPVLSVATPVELWLAFGSVYTLALLLMFTGLVALCVQLKNLRDRIGTKGLWLLLFGLCLVIAGDAVHTATWHQNGLTVPTPGTNPVANTAYAIHMMGMNLVMVGAMVVGVTALRKKLFASWLAWLFVAIFPSAIVLTTTLLPTTPSGGLWIFSLMMVALGYSLASGRSPHLVIA